ncbi:MAG TPA: hypothetical protein VKM56_09820, partial [Verrucomicrobiae bacterium]|nr:hypothetical protein [Verrucomicrobiae bacterium]
EQRGQENDEKHTRHNSLKQRQPKLTTKFHALTARAQPRRSNRREPRTQLETLTGVGAAIFSDGVVMAA